MKIDNFALTMHQTCPAKYDLRINQKYTTRRKSAALGFGTALHAGLAAWYKSGRDLTSALNAIGQAWPPDSPDDYRSMEKCVNVMMDYHRTYNGSEMFQVIGAGTETPIVEQPFTLETGMFLSCLECGPVAGAWDGIRDTCPNCLTQLEPIEYGGIIDTGVFDPHTKMAYVLEHKSTSMLGDYYFDAFKPNNQITGYIWGLTKLSNLRVAGAIVNAIGVMKSSATKFKREITSRSQQDITTFLENVRATCEEIQWHRRTGTWPMRTTACVLYGKCEYHQVHLLDSKEHQQKRLEQDYIKDEWNFEKRD